MKMKMSEWIQSVHDYYDNKPVDRWVEKFLVEICASSKEGKSNKEIAEDLGIRRGIVSKVIQTDREYAKS